MIKGDIATDKDKPKQGARQRNAIKRREHLSSVVMQMVSEKGFDAISVNDVAERASMSVGGLYRHINTKNDLLEMICDSINSDLILDLKKAAADVKGVSNKLRAAYSFYWNRHWEASAGILVAYREYRSLSEATKQRYLDEEEEVVKFLGDIIRAGILIEEFREVDEYLLGHEMVFLAHMKALKGWSMRNHQQEDVLNEHLEMIFSRLMFKDS